MKAVETRDHEIHVGKCGGFDMISATTGVRFIQCRRFLSHEFELAGHVRGESPSLYQALKEYDLWEVDAPFGDEGGFILGAKIGPIRRMLKHPAGMQAIVAVSKAVNSDQRFGLAIDCVSRINMAISGEGYMVSLMDKKGRVLETIDHLPEEEDVNEIVKYLYENALVLEGRA
jgi:hypothetical protein